MQSSALAFVRHVNVFNCLLVAFHAIIPGSKSTFSVLMIRKRATCLHSLMYRGGCAALRSAFSTIRRAQDSYDPTSLRNIAVVAHIGRNTSLKWKILDLTLSNKRFWQNDSDGIHSCAFWLSSDSGYCRHRLNNYGFFAC